MQRLEERLSHQYLLKTPAGSDLSCSSPGPCLNWSSTEVGSTTTWHPGMDYAVGVRKTLETQTTLPTFKNSIRIGNRFEVHSPTLHLQLCFFRGKKKEKKRFLYVFFRKKKKSFSYVLGFEKQSKYKKKNILPKRRTNLGGTPQRIRQAIHKTAFKCSSWLFLTLMMYVHMIRINPLASQREKEKGVSSWAAFHSLTIHMFHC